MGVFDTERGGPEFSPFCQRGRPKSFSRLQGKASSIDYGDRNTHFTDLVPLDRGVAALPAVAPPSLLLSVNPRLSPVGGATPLSKDAKSAKRGLSIPIVYTTGPPPCEKITLP